MKKIFTTYKNVLYVILIIIVFSSSILINSYFHKNGFLSPDATIYLALSQNLIDGAGYYVNAYFNIEKEKEFFAAWPIGYPTMIFAVAKITGLSVFWASKILNIFLAILCLIVLKKSFKENVYVYGLVFFCGAFLGLFSYTGSEAPFIFGLIWLAYGITTFLQSEKNICLITIFFASIFLFLSRYVGAFSFGLIFLCALYFLYHRDYNKGIKLFIIAVLGFMVASCYVYFNYSQTGHLTGVNRVFVPETNWEFVGDSLKHIFYELNFALKRQSNHKILFVLTFILQIFAYVYLYRRIKSAPPSVNNATHDIVWKVYLLVGTFYFVLIVTLRWFLQFSDLYYRFLAPGTVLMCFALIRFMQTRYSPKIFNTFKNILLSFAVLSVVINIPWAIYKDKTYKNEKMYYQTLSDLTNKYRTLPQKSVVINANPHIHYLRPDIKTPVISPQINLDRLLSFVAMHEDKNIYLEFPQTKSKKSKSRNFHKTVIEFAEKHKETDLIFLR